MNPARILLATAAVSTATLAAIAPAMAYTARQYAAQGHGVYLTSKGMPEGYGYGPRYGYYPAWRYRRGPLPDQTYYGGYGYGFDDGYGYDYEGY